MLDNYSANNHPYCLPLSTNDSFSHLAALCCCSLPHLYSPRECILIAADDGVSRGPPKHKQASKHLSVTWDIKLWSAAYHSSPHKTASSSFSSSLHSCSVCHVGNRCAQFSALNYDPFQAFYSPWAGKERKKGMDLHSELGNDSDFFFVWCLSSNCFWLDHKRIRILAYS